MPWFYNYPINFSCHPFSWQLLIRRFSFRVYLYIDALGCYRMHVDWICYAWDQAPHRIVRSQLVPSQELRSRPPNIIGTEVQQDDSLPIFSAWSLQVWRYSPFDLFDECWAGWLTIIRTLQIWASWPSHSCIWKSLRSPTAGPCWKLLCLRRYVHVCFHVCCSRIVLKMLLLLPSQGLNLSSPLHKVLFLTLQCHSCIYIVLQFLV
jgi:hypothetical protein